jgi:hypothetical protein
MSNATATYHAPEGDNKVVEMGGVTFFDGQPVELNIHDHGRMIEKLRHNQHFAVEAGDDENSDGEKQAAHDDETKRRRGRPRKGEHHFEPHVGPEPAED